LKYKFGVEDLIWIDLGFPYDIDGSDATITVEFDSSSSSFLYYDEYSYIITEQDGVTAETGEFSMTATVTGASKK
jgi:hypothetical protein